MERDVVLHAGRDRLVAARRSLTGENGQEATAALRAAQAEAVKFNLMAGTPAPHAQQKEDVAAVLRQLVSLHEEGLLTDEELAAKRAEVIARI